MTPEEREVLRAALAWWRSKRPVGYSREDHIGNATVNTTSPAERRLAVAVSMLVEVSRHGG